MQSIHDYDPELQKYVKLTRLGKVKLTPRVVRLANFLGKSTFIKFHKDTDITRKRYEIKGYQNTPLDIISYAPKDSVKITPAILFFFMVEHLC